jgi:hypothetical protein
MNISSSLATKIADLAQTAVDQAFTQQIRSSVAEVGSVESALQFPGLNHLLLPSRLAAVYEGIVIEKSFGLALQDDENFAWIGKKSVEITDADRGLAERNLHKDLGPIDPPPAGRSIGRAEIDCLVVDLRTGELKACDVKRAVPVGDGNPVRFTAITLAVKRALRDEGLTFMRILPVKLRWFAIASALPSGVVCRDTVDEALGACVREVVDLAVKSFRVEYASRLRVLLGNSPYDPTPTAPLPPSPRPARHAIDLAALQRAFSRGARFGRDA